MVIADNAGHIIAPVTVKAINEHDSALLPESLDKLIQTADRLGLNISNAPLTLDPAFDGQENRDNVKQHKNMIPVIKPNVRNASPETKKAIRAEFKPLEPIYKERYKIERDFAWKCNYRKLVIRYEILQCTHLGFKHLAYAMVNFREIFQAYG
jgi:hypothetical protein